MGIAIYVQGYKKKEASISGQIKCLDWYEIEKEAVQNEKIEGTSTVLHDAFSVIDYLDANNYLSDYGIYGKNEISFYYNIPNGMNGASFRNENGKNYELMFGPNNIQTVLPKLLRVANWAKGRSGMNFNAENAIIELQTFSEIVEKVKAENGLISFFMG